MNREDRALIKKILPGLSGIREMSLEDFAKKFRGGVYDFDALVRDLLTEAFSEKNSGDVEYALNVGFNFGFSEIQVPVLALLSEADWHFRHEDVASAMDKIRTSECLSSLKHLADWVPPYLEFDENRALARKAVWAIFKIYRDTGDEEAKVMLSRLSDSDSEKVSGFAKKRLLEL